MHPSPSRRQLGLMANSLHRPRLLSSSELAKVREVLDLFGDVFEEPETYCGAQPSNAYLESALREGRFFMVVVEEAGFIVGALTFYELFKFEQERSELFIYDLAVHVDHRRRGIASAMIEYVRTLARERGAYLVWVQSESDDEPSSRTYDHFSKALKANHYEIQPAGSSAIPTP